MDRGYHRMRTIVRTISHGDARGQGRQHPQLLVTLAPGDRRVDEQRLRLLRIEQALTGEFERPELRVHEALRLVRAEPDLARLPDLPELGALRVQIVGDRRRPRPGTAPCDHLAQPRRPEPREVVVLV